MFTAASNGQTPVWLPPPLQPPEVPPRPKTFATAASAAANTATSNSSTGSHTAAATSSPPKPTLPPPPATSPAASASLPPLLPPVAFAPVALVLLSHYPLFSSFVTFLKMVRSRALACARVRLVDLILLAESIGRPALLAYAHAHPLGPGMASIACIDDEACLLESRPSARACARVRVRCSGASALPRLSIRHAVTARTIHRQLRR
jgi:hypothetical protein